MALQLSLTSGSSGIGVAVPEAYARVVSFQYNVNESKVYFALEYHWNAAARAALLQPIRVQSFFIDNFDFTTDIAVKKALYNYLKTLPAFADAIDV